MSGKRAQIAPEAVLIAAVMLFLLLAMYIVSAHMSQQWDVEKQRMEASSAANALALEINSVAAGGNGTTAYYFNSAGPDVASMTIYQGRSLRAGYKEGGFESVALVTNRTKVGTNLLLNNAIPLNAYLWLNNSDDTVNIAGA